MDHTDIVLTGDLKPFKLTSVTETDRGFLASEAVFMTFHFSSDFERRGKKEDELEKILPGAENEIRFCAAV